jgi:hypothetical protein
MIANFFSKSKPVNIFNLVVLLVLYYIISFIFINNEALIGWDFVINISLFLLLIVGLIVVNFIINKNNLTLDNLYGLLMFVLLLGSFPEAMFANKIVFSNLLLLISYRKIYSIKSGHNTTKKLFDAGFWIGIATLIYPLSIFYIALVFVSVIIFQKIYFKNLFIPVIGLVTPLFLFFTYVFYIDKLELFYNLFQYNLNFDFSIYNQLNNLLPLTFLITITLWSLVVVTPKINLVSNTLRMSWNVLINQLLIATVVVVLAPNKNGSELFFVIFPCAIIIANFLQKSQSSNFKNLILYLFLILSISIYLL